MRPGTTRDETAEGGKRFAPLAPSIQCDEPVRSDDTANKERMRRRVEAAAAGVADLVDRARRGDRAALLYVGEGPAPAIAGVPGIAWQVPPAGGQAPPDARERAA